MLHSYATHGLREKLPSSGRSRRLTVESLIRNAELGAAFRSIERDEGGMTDASLVLKALGWIGLTAGSQM